MTDDKGVPRPVSLRPPSDGPLPLRVRLLDAAIEALVDLGWSGTTTVEVCRRARCSRGAQLHHFPSRLDLMLAAAEYTVAISIDAINTRLLTVEKGDICAVVTTLIALYDSREFYAGIELRYAARHDVELRARTGALFVGFTQALAAAAADRLDLSLDDEVEEARVWMILDLLRGFGMRTRDALVPGPNDAVIEQVVNSIAHVVKPESH